MGYAASREAAKILGVHPNTLRKWADSGQRKYDVRNYLGKSRPSQTICCCRVSSYKQKDDLQRQVE